MICQPSPSTIAVTVDDASQAKPRCGLLASPDSYTAFGLQAGRDRTETLKDQSAVREWAKGRFHHHDTRWFSDDHHFGLWEDDVHAGLADAHAQEVTFSYYAGHGLDPSAARDLSYSSYPQLELLAPAGPPPPDYPAPTRVKGGELCLDARRGFCGFWGWLRPFAAALAGGDREDKRNKHVVGVFDSCFSGVFCDDLDTAKRGKEPAIGNWAAHNCTVTDETTRTRMMAGYGALWPDFRSAYAEALLPEPQLASTSSRVIEQIGQGLLMVESERHDDGTSLFLFADPTFKYCVVRLHYEASFPCLVLGEQSATGFLRDHENRQFNVLDFRLTTTRKGRHRGNLLGLFLIENPHNADHAVGAHVHFGTNASVVRRVDLVDNRAAGPAALVRWREDLTGLVERVVWADDHKIAFGAWLGYWPWQRVEDIRNLTDSERRDHKLLAALIASCKSLVDSHDPSLWDDPSKWTGGPSAFGHLLERKVWLQDYLADAATKGLPTV